MATQKQPLMNAAGGKPAVQTVPEGYPGQPQQTPANVVVPANNYVQMPVESYQSYPSDPPPPGADDPCCLYVLGAFSILIPIIGFIGMCCFNCGSGLGPNKTKGFKVMVICTVIGCIVHIIWYLATDCVVYQHSTDTSSVVVRVC